MLKAAIETEGLIRIMKDGDPSQETLSLLKEKISKLCEFSEKLEASETKTHSSEKPLQESEASETIHDTLDNTKDSDEIFLFAEDDETSQSSPASKSAVPSSPHPADLKKYFSINDRYLYSRELFDGDMKMFDSTLRFLEGISDFSDIEDYFYSELEWDPEDSNVASFLDMLRPHFKE